jgi:hypothetical protein
MRVFTATSGAVLLASLLQGCQSTDYQMAYASAAEAPARDMRTIQVAAEQKVGLRDQARAYAARLNRDGCVKSPEGATFEAASADFERNLAALKRGDNQLAGMPNSGTAAETATTLAEARLQVGDAASASGCLDVANTQYKAVLRSVSGPAYASYRQRAELGLSASLL